MHQQHSVMPRIMAASAMLGYSVQNSAGENLGKLDEVMIDIVSGRIAYAVLSFGGFLGMGNKLFAIPWSALSLDIEGKRYILDVDKKLLKEAPGFDRDDWPDMADPRWGLQIHEHYGIRPYWE
jgi:sporulation protein YlmC with PRC-barrel domain